MWVSIHPIPDVLEANLSLLEIAFVSDYNDWDWLSLDPAVKLIDPVVEFFEGGKIGEIEYQQNYVGVAVISCYGMGTMMPSSGISISQQCPKYFGWARPLISSYSIFCSKLHQLLARVVLELCLGNILQLGLSFPLRHCLKVRF